MGKSRRDLEKEKYWRSQVDEWHRSGKSVVSYCREHGIKSATFHWWKRELFIRDCELSTAGSSGDITPESMIPGFSEVKVVARSPLCSDESLPYNGGDSGLEVMVSENRRVRVYRGFDASVLVQLLHVLEHTPC